MKQKRFKTFWGMMLGFALIAAAVPCAVFGQAGAEEEPPDVVITIKAELAGDVEFEFREYKIFYESDDLSDPPAGATVNGIPWPDLKKPFEMGFTPDFSFAEIYEKSGRGSIELAVKPDRFILSVDDSKGDFAPYQISISMKRQPVSGTPDKKTAASNGKKLPNKSSAKQGNHVKPLKKKKKR